jgi:hypothetical protein
MTGPRRANYGETPPMVIAAIMDCVDERWKIEECKIITILERQYILGGVSYYSTGHYTLKLFTPPTYETYIVYDNLNQRNICKAPPKGRANLLFYFPFNVSHA